jgi:Zn-dependent peptidase ImmA (M78 family)
LISVSANKAKQLLKEFGIRDITAVTLEDIAFAKNAIVEEISSINADGRTIFGSKYAIIRVNKNIEYIGKKRFTIAHEIGHLILHRGVQPVFLDNDATLEYFKKGHQETEANEFASELLMPEEQFREECKGKKFSPDFLRYLSEKFQTSITSTVYRYFEHGNQPICLVYSHNNKVLYWKRPEGYDHFLIDYTRMSPPEDSVAAEFFREDKIYPRNQSKQQIWKSTWFDLKSWENDNNYKFYEYCIITPRYNTVLSVIWQE